MDSLSQEERARIRASFNRMTPADRARVIGSGSERTDTYVDSTRRRKTPDGAPVIRSRRDPDADGPANRLAASLGIDPCFLTQLMLAIPLFGFMMFTLYQAWFYGPGSTSRFEPDE